MSLFLFDRDPLSGAVETWEYDENREMALIHRREDVEPIIERNKELQNADDRGWGASRHFRREATIPAGVQLLWRERYGIDIHNPDHMPGVKRLLNSSEWRYLRTSPGLL